MSNIKKGIIGENAAVKYLTSLGYDIITRNYRAEGCEIDIIARSGDFLAFCEVKLRTTLQYGNPSESVTYTKRKNIIKAAMAYLEKNPTSLQPRFDVVEVYAKKDFNGISILKVNLLENAFGVD